MKPAPSGWITIWPNLMNNQRRHPAEFVADDRRFKSVVRQLTQEQYVAVDMESNGFFRYPETICLIQVASEGGVFLIDPPEIQDMSPLGEVLGNRDIVKIVHSADYDLRSLDREWGFRVANLFDTSVGAHFCGLDKLGLGTVVSHFLGVTLDKEKRLQRADWGVRPLTEEALDYAAADVTYLFKLRTVINEELARLGRVDWVIEECQRLEEIRFEGQEPPELAYFHVKGSRTLDGRGLAILKCLFIFREKEALRRGRPPFRVLSNETMLHIAANPKVELKDVPGVTALTIQRYGETLKRLIEEGLEAPIEKRPPPLYPMQPRPTTEHLARMQKLRNWRTEVGKGLTLDPALVWPMASLERLMRTPGSYEQELASGDVRRWQIAQFGEALNGVLAG